MARVPDSRLKLDKRYSTGLSCTVNLTIRWNGIAHIPRLPRIQVELPGTCSCIFGATNLSA
eukprot:5677008-Karenia_brevis.AAC.1